VTHSYSRQLALGKDKFLGCATSANIWPGLNVYWNQVTPGNDGKWESVEGVQGQYNFTNLDNIYNYALNNGLLFKEHCLVWGNQQPGWIAGLDSAARRAAVRKWIDTIGHRYPSISFVDVVNEPFHAPPVYAKALGDSGVTGWDWVITAFQWARESCALGVKLILNEYNILSNYDVTTNYINLISLLKVRGLIDGIGIQGHYFEFRSRVGASGGYTYDINTIKLNLNRLATLGLPIYITEFDVDEPVDATQLAQYQIYFPIFWDHPAVKGITFWGYIQSDVWTSFPETYLLRSDGSERPVLPWMRTYILVGPPPAIPSLVSPKSTSDENRKTTFVWRSAAYAKKYQLQVATDNVFSAIVLDTTITDTTFTLSDPLDANTMHFWRVCAINLAGVSAFSTMALFTTGTLDDVERIDERIPGDFGLSQNYPNPFNPSTTIHYDVPKSAYVTITIYDVLGGVIATLVDGIQSARSHSVQWTPSGLGSGVYFCRMEARSQDGSSIYASVKKLLFLK
jgi:endo-1,4-beta-xylanase